MARILVIDDDAAVRQMVKVMLEREGHQVMVAESGQSGLKQIETDLPDAAVIDLMMPGMSGYDVTRQLRANPATVQLPILILTARNQPMDQQIAMRIGASAFMSKPVVSRDLAERVAQILAAPVPEVTPAPVPTATSTAAAPSTESPPAANRSTLSQTGTLRRLNTGSDPSLRRPTLPIISVLAAERGSGSTTLAVNLTFALRRQIERVCLVDLHPYGGEVMTALRLSSAHSWADLLSANGPLDIRTVSGILTPYAQQGVAVIGSPGTPPPMLPTATLLSSLFTVLGSGFGQIVLDLGEWTDISVAALRMSRVIILAAGTNPTSAGAAAGLASRLRGLSIPPDRVRLVVTHTRPNSLITASAISEASLLPVSLELPFDPLQAQALQRGVPLVSLAQNAPYTQTLAAWSRTLTGLQ